MARARTASVEEHSTHDMDREEGSDTDRALARLAAVAATPQADLDGLIESVLALLAESLDVGLVHLSRVAGASQVIERVHDRAGLGVPAGAVVPLSESYCQHLLASTAPALVIADARHDPRVAGLAATRDLGIGAYTGVPLYRADGALYGTLCTVHPHVRTVAAGEVTLLALAGRLLMQAVALAEGQARERQLRDTVAAAAQARAVYSVLACGVVVLDAAGRIVDANAAAEEVLGVSVAAMRGQMLADSLWQPTLPDGTVLPAPERPATRALRTGQPQRAATVRLTRPDGTARWLQIDAVPLPGPDGRPAQVIVSSIDVTEREEAVAALRASEERFRALSEQAADLVLIVGPDGAYRYASPSHEAALGYLPAALRGMSLFALLHPEDRAHAQEAFARLAQGQTLGTPVTCRIRAADGAWRTYECLGRNRLHDPAVAGLIINARDVTERVAAEKALRHQALYDPLTELPNRTLLADRLAQALRAAPRERRPLALLLLDLDRFKEVNDTFGHPTGDRLLRTIGRRLRRTLRAADTVARLGGDEFAVLLPGADAPGAQRAAEKIRRALERPVGCAARRVAMGASIGIALAPAHGTDAATLLRRADVAMYQAKRAGGAAVVYDPAQDRSSPARLTLGAGLRQALAHGELVLHYQPKVECASGRVTRVEALVRWQHPRRGLLPPDQFIALAEDLGLMTPLTLWVLEEALRQGRAWRATGLALGLNVNLSLSSLHDPALPDTVATLLRRHESAPADLRLEVTESTMMADMERTVAALGRLAALGVHIAVDDFGTGYSSLAYLKRLPVDELKIDKSFVRHLTSDAADATIVASTIALGHGLGLRVVAEGVEDRATLDQLAAWGCDAAQGYYLSRPLPAAELERWVRAWPAATSALAHAG